MILQIPGWYVTEGVAGCSWSKGWYRKAAALEALGRIAEAEEAAGEGADFGDSKELVAQRVRLRGLCLQSAIRALFFQYHYPFKSFYLESQGGVCSYMPLPLHAQEGGV